MKNWIFVPKINFYTWRFRASVVLNFLKSKCFISFRVEANPALAHITKFVVFSSCFSIYVFVSTCKRNISKTDPFTVELIYVGINQGRFYFENKTRSGIRTEGCVWNCGRKVRNKKHERHQKSSPKVNPPTNVICLTCSHSAYRKYWNISDNDEWPRYFTF